MRRATIIVLVAVILGGVVFFEYWSFSQFPKIDFELSPLEDLLVDVSWEYDYFKEDVKVGSYVWWVESKDTRDGETVYVARSRTSVEHEGKPVELVSVYVFSKMLVPLEYRLNVSLEGEEQFVECFFEGWSVIASLSMEGHRVEEPLTLEEGTVLVDYFMPGHWDLFFRAFTLPPGRRVAFNAYIPQVLAVNDLELVADKAPKTTTIDGTEYECNVVRAPEINIWFYFYEGDLIKMEDTEQNIVLSRSS
ncbi:MAG: hypothetical protein JSV27_07195 [Candidatus Bathyarchaeota archaeon]|nr:MAG: hypothetical protein JSV27_07195 [Candidatus Bathyarchaeota archaeon]